VSTRLVILGLLRDRPLYGYEIKQIIEGHMGDWTSIAFGSIYFALDKLTEEGLTRKVATERKGDRPSRSVYRITAAGRAEFTRLLRQTWGEVEHHYYAFDIALAFMEGLPAKETKRILRERIRQMEIVQKQLAAHRKEQLKRKEVPRVASAIFEHSRVHLKAELDWTRDLLKKVERHEYP
jgi:DNA-binding PadR family transcriptional regulator